MVCRLVPLGARILLPGVCDAGAISDLLDGWRRLTATLSGLKYTIPARENSKKETAPGRAGALKKTVDGGRKVIVFYAGIRKSGKF